MTSEKSHCYHIRIHGFREVWCDERWGARGTKGKKDILLPFMEQPEKTKLLFVRVYCQRRWEKTTLSNSKKKNRGLKGRTDQREEERRIKFVYLLFYTGLNEDELRMNQTEWIEWMNYNWMRRLASQWILMETGPGSYTEEKSVSFLSLPFCIHGEVLCECQSVSFSCRRRHKNVLLYLRGIYFPFVW